MRTKKMWYFLRGIRKIFQVKAATAIGHCSRHGREESVSSARATDITSLCAKRQFLAPARPLLLRAGREAFTTGTCNSCEAITFKLVSRLKALANVISDAILPYALLYSAALGVSGSRMGVTSNASTTAQRIWKRRAAILMEQSYQCV